MTQDELNQLYQSLEDQYGESDTPEKGFEEYLKRLDETGALMIGCDWKQFGPVVYDFIELMQKHGFVVLENPADEGTSDCGWVIWEPKE